ncbi:hypothetical protein Tco_1274506 [Tanacetum coccineum]
MDEDIAMLFGDNDFEDDDSEGFDEEEVWEADEEWLMAPVTPLNGYWPSGPNPPSIYEGLGKQNGRLDIQGDEMAPAQECFGDLVEDTAAASQVRCTLCSVLFGMDKRLADLERRPPRPQ